LPPSSRRHRPFNYRINVSFIPFPAGNLIRREECARASARCQLNQRFPLSNSRHLPREALAQVQDFGFPRVDAWCTPNSSHSEAVERVWLDAGEYIFDAPEKNWAPNGETRETVYISRPKFMPNPPYNNHTRPNP